LCPASPSAKNIRMTRPDWDTYFMRAAYLAATRATCDRKHVGALIVDPYHRIVATGYNGAPSGMPSCDEPDVGHEIVDGHCVRSLHAESNAIDFAGRFAMGCSIYVTVTPCYDCAKRIVNVGIVHVLWDEFYQSRYGKSAKVADFLASAGIKVTQLEKGRMDKFKAALADV
jgi:dCMP deaminase